MKKKSIIKTALIALTLGLSAGASFSQSLLYDKYHSKRTEWGNEFQDQKVDLRPKDKTDFETLKELIVEHQYQMDYWRKSEVKPFKGQIDDICQYLNQTGESSVPFDFGVLYEDFVKDIGKFTFIDMTNGYKKFWHDALRISQDDKSIIEIDLWTGKARVFEGPERDDVQEIAEKLVAKYRKHISKGTKDLLEQTKRERITWLETQSKQVGFWGPGRPAWGTEFKRSFDDYTIKKESDFQKIGDYVSDLETKLELWRRSDALSLQAKSTDIVQHLRQICSKDDRVFGSVYQEVVQDIGVFALLDIKQGFEQYWFDALRISQTDVGSLDIDLFTGHARPYLTEGMQDAQKHAEKFVDEYRSRIITRLEQLLEGARIKEQFEKISVAGRPEWGAEMKHPGVGFSIPKRSDYSTHAAFAKDAKIIIKLWADAEKKSLPEQLQYIAEFLVMTQSIDRKEGAADIYTSGIPGEFALEVMDFPEKSGFGLLDRIRLSILTLDAHIDVDFVTGKGLYFGKKEDAEIQEIIGQKITGYMAAKKAELKKSLDASKKKEDERARRLRARPTRPKSKPKSVLPKFKPKKRSTPVDPGAVTRYCVMVSGHTEYRHKENLRDVFNVVTREGYLLDDVYILNSGTNTPQNVKEAYNKAGLNRNNRTNANEADVYAVLEEIKSRIDSNDILFFYATNHGGRSGRESYICFTGDIYEHELEEKMEDLYKRLVDGYIIQFHDQCYSGGFPERFKRGHHIGFAASKPGKSSVNRGFPKAWTEAYLVARDKADKDGNGIITLKEAYDYAVKHDDNKSSNTPIWVPGPKYKPGRTL